LSSAVENSKQSGDAQLHYIEAWRVV
jgi:hypothetical protein